MPRGDRTGPEGFGPMSGRGMGYCAGNDRPGFMEAGPGMGAGRGLGRGRGFGRGFGRGYGRRAVNFRPQYNPSYGPQTQANKEDEVNYLENVAKDLKNELEAVQKRLDDLKDEEN